MKKKPNWFLRIVLVFFLIFLVMYISSINGYKEKRLHDKIIITEDAIKEFESDILAGKDVEVIDYLNNDYIDYSNKLTKAGDAITDQRSPSLLLKASFFSFKKFIIFNPSFSASIIFLSYNISRHSFKPQYPIVIVVLSISQRGSSVSLSF